MKKIFGALLISSFFVFGLSAQSFAYEIEQTEAADENRFELGPTLFEIKTKPDESFTKQLQLTNRSGHEQKYSIFLRDFQGSPDNPLQFTQIFEDEVSDYGASSWFDIELDTVYLEHGERLFFNVDINIPETADPGEHYTMVIVEPDEVGSIESGGAVIQMKARTGSLFLIDVEGKRVKNGSLVEFFTDFDFYENTPVRFNVDVRNTGTVHLKPSGRIEIYNWFGKKVDDVEVKEYIVLRDSIRRQTGEWNKSFAIGKYNAKLFIDLDLGQDPVESEIEFWVIPWKLLLILVIVIIVVGIGLKLLLSKVKIEVKLK